MTKAFDQHEEGTESPSSGSLHDDPINMEEGTFGSEINISATATPRRPQGLQRQNGARNITKTKAYSWKKFLRAKTLSDVFHWLINGFSPDVKQSEEEMLEDLNNTALLLTLLREYYNRFGMPDEGGPKDQEFVLREVTKDLYSSGCPIWALENVMQQCSEGLTGNQGVDFFVLPRKAFIFAPSSGATVMFKLARGWNMRRLSATEKLAVRLASFASNTDSVASLPSSRMPKFSEMRSARRTQSVISQSDISSKDHMAERILDLAADTQGLFHYINSKQVKIKALAENERGDDEDFWEAGSDISELFSRLAAAEAMRGIKAIDSMESLPYSKYLEKLFQLFTSAGACAIWFDGSWFDIIMAGFLGVLVAAICTKTNQVSRDGRVIAEVVASFSVGLIAAIVALLWPEHTCFGAMALSGTIDILQGFRVVFAVIELMGKHTVSGGANFLEGMLYTALIAMSLKFGQFSAMSIMSRFQEDVAFSTCENGIDKAWYFLFLPIAAISWSGLFDPFLSDIPLMAFHGVLAYVVSWAVALAGGSPSATNFIAAVSVTFSSGLCSRFIGRNALANSIAGIYVLLPGAYLVNEIYNTDQAEGFLESIIFRSIIIGIGAWTGTLLCSPTVLGSTRGILTRFTRGSKDSTRRDTSVRKSGTGELLFF